MSKTISAAATGLPTRRLFLAAGSAAAAGALIGAAHAVGASASALTLKKCANRLFAADRDYLAAILVDEDHPDLGHLWAIQDTAMRDGADLAARSIEELKIKAAMLDVFRGSTSLTIERMKNSIIRDLVAL